MQRQDGEQEDRVIAAESASDRHRQSNATTIAWAVSIITYLALTLFLPILDSDGSPPDWAAAQGWGPFLYELRVGFGNALVTFFMFTVIYDVVKRVGAESTERALFGALSGSPRIVGMLSDPKKRQHVKHTLQALLGDDQFANALFGEVIEPILSSRGGYRSSYQYTVTMLEPGDYPRLDGFVSLQSLISDDSYLWIREQIDYTAHYPEGGALLGEATIVLAFDNDSLQSLYSEPLAYFRSLIELDADTKTAFFALSTIDIERFLKEAMCFRLTETVTKKRVNFQVSVDKSPTGLPVVTVTAAALQNRSSKNKLRVDFIYPHQKSATHFTFSMPQPCRNPYMAFRGCSRIQCLEMFDYISRVPQDRRRVEPMGTETNPTGFEIEIDGWVFPMSGVTFTWRNK